MTKKYISKAIIVVLAMGTTFANAQSINQWRGGEDGAEWENRYKWERRHPPTGEESAHFREPTSVITINSTIQLNNGMHLYGQELSLQGNGNINMQSQIQHKRTINIPASATGFANLSLNDTLSLNGRIALSAKGFGTSASKGTITLNDRSNVTGPLSIGSAGAGTGKVFVKENSTYRITDLELSTKAESGGSAEIHILGGMVRLETRSNPFDTFLEDTSRRIIIGDAGTLRIEHDASVMNKKEALKSMILQKRLVAAPGCRLTLPLVKDNMIIVRAEDERNDSEFTTTEALVAAIDDISESSSTVADTQSDAPQLGSLLQTMRDDAGIEESDETVEESTETDETGNGAKLAGYIVFLGGAMLVLRRPSKEG